MRDSLMKFGYGVKRPHRIAVSEVPRDAAQFRGVH